MLDLGVDPNKLQPELARILYEIERGKRKELTPAEAAAYFFAAAWTNIPEPAILLPMSPAELAGRAVVIMNEWVATGKMRAACYTTFTKSLVSQLP